jgi:hypothetical protein
MKALSLLQPWASGIALGFKEWETRSWPTKYRGEVAIHASKRLPKEARELLRHQPFSQVIETNGLEKFLLVDNAINALPFGAIIAVATLADCKRVEDVAPFVSIDEGLWGDFSPGRHAWQMKGVILLPQPVACAGALGLWQVPADVERQVHEQLGETAR